MYDTQYAEDSINSAKFRSLARKEAAALIKLLGLKEGDRLLDVPCGTARHSVEFAKHGLQVTAVDINPLLLKLARKNQGNLRLNLEKGDMSKLRKYRGKFDAVVNLFTSFGYFSSDQKNEKVLRELASTLKPGGKIAIHLINPDWLMTVFQPLGWNDTSTDVQIEARHYDPKTKYNQAYRIVIDKRTGKTTTNFHRIRFYTKSEMVVLMKKCGLKNVRVVGNYDGATFSKKKSTHPIYLGEVSL